MIKIFLIERRSWILVFATQQLLLIFIAVIDSAIPLHSMLYLVFLSILLFIIFLVLRYNKETRFYKKLEDWDHNTDYTSRPNPESPFEHIIEFNISRQIEDLQRKSSQQLTLLEQEKDDLLAWIHEVKTPLTAMHLMIDRLNDEPLKNQLTYEWLRIHLLLDQQLYQRKIPFMENDLYVELIDLESIIFDEIKTLQSWCIHKGIGFDLELKQPNVLGDAKWLAFIVRQLLTNAVKYSEASDISIISFESLGKSVLEVRDCGRGIDPRDLPRIFDKGFTSTMLHQDHASTGMGLYLANKAARSLHIHIDVESKLDVGTTFRLTFPQRNEFDHITGM